MQPNQMSAKSFFWTFLLQLEYVLIIFSDIPMDDENDFLSSASHHCFKQWTLLILQHLQPRVLFGNLLNENFRMTMSSYDQRCLFISVRFCFRFVGHTQTVSSSRKYALEIDWWNLEDSQTEQGSDKRNHGRKTETTFYFPLWEQRIIYRPFPLLQTVCFNSCS